MTVTLVYGDPSDAQLTSTNATYTTARNGPASGAVLPALTAAFYGQNNNAGTYSVFQTFIRFTYPAVSAQELVTSAAVRLWQLSQLGTGVARDLEVRSFAWEPTVDLADWRNPTQLAAAPLQARVVGVQASQGRWTPSGSDDLRALVQGSTGASFVVVSSRQRAGNVPTTDEGSSLATADQSGTALDPCLVYTTAPLHALVPVMGMEAQLSDGSWVFGVRPVGTGSVTLYREDQAGVATQVATIPIGTGSGEWGDVAAAQGMTLAVDDGDNLYVVGRAGDAPNSIRHRAYAKASGSWTWTARTIRSIPTPAHDAPINNVTAAWHPTAGGTLVVFVSHLAGDGVSGGVANDVAYILINSQFLLDGVGSQLRATGSAIQAGLLPGTLPSQDFSGYANETGSGLDVVADRSQRDWGYLVSFKRSQRLGDNAALPVGRYQLTSTGAGFSTALHEEKSAYGRKDGGGKARILAVGSGQVAVVSADADPGWGLTVQVLQSNGSSPGWVSLGYVNLSGEAIPGLPDGPAVASVPTWDAIYSASENSLWVYYVSATNPNNLRRTSVNLSTYRATRVDVAVHTASGAIQAVRAPRNSWVGTRTHVTLAVPAGYQRVVDTLNLPPLAPTLTLRANYDATAAATFAWTFRDSNAGDTQSAFQLQVVRVSDGVTVHDTGKVASSVSSRLVAGGTLANGQDYRWRVMTWDSLGTAGPWSDYGTFSTGAGGTVTITDPAVDNPPDVITDDYLVAWSVAGTVQAKVRAWVTRNDTGATVHDSGWLTTAATTHRVAGMATDVEHTVRVQVENSSAVRTNTATRRITPSYGTPEVPLLQVEADHDGGHVLVTVTNPPPQGDRPDVIRNRVLRRRSGTQDPWDDLGTCDPDGSFRDFTAPSGVPLEYMARGETA